MTLKADYVDNLESDPNLIKAAWLNKVAFLVNGANTVVTTIATLRGVIKTDSTSAFVLGYYAKGDGGGGAYYYDSADTTTADNGGTTIVAADGGRWKLIHNGIVSVRQFGAKGDGTTLDTTAFTNAQAALAFVYVPAGANCKVGSGLNYWKFFGPGQVFENGRQWDTNPHSQNGQVLRNYRQRTFGNYENAVSISFSINSTDAQLFTNTQVVGTTTQGMATYTDRDHVGMYGQAHTYEPDVTGTGSTYTSTTLTDSATIPALIAAGSLKVGMIIDTKHATKLVGRIQSWAGSTITVDGWWAHGTGNAGTPANGTGAIINPNTKIWGQNTNIFVGGLSSNNQAQRGTGYELGIFCDPSIGVNIWGFDAVTLAGKPEAHFISRGACTYGFTTTTGADYGFHSDTNSRGFHSQDDTIPFEALQGATSVWHVGSNGAAVSNGVAELGVGPLQCTNAAFLNIGPVSVTYGSLVWVHGFNVSGGAEAHFLLMVRSGAVSTVFGNDLTGLAITFQATGRQLQIKCGNAGTFQFVSSHVYTP